MGFKSAKQQKFIKYHVIFSSYNIFLIKEGKVELEEYVFGDDGEVDENFDEEESFNISLDNLFPYMYYLAKRVHEISDHYFKEAYYQKMRQIVDKLYSKIIR